MTTNDQGGGAGGGGALPLPYLAATEPVVLAHRGFSPDGLENSLSAFQAAVDLGCDYVETDVHATADGVAIAFHDDTLDRVTDASGRIAELAWDDVRRARIGGVEAVPTLADVLASWPDLRVNIDLKSAAAVAPTVALVNRMRAHDRVCIGSFNDRRRRAAVAAMDRRVATSAGTGTVRAFVAAVAVGSAGLVRRILRDVDCLQLPERSSGVTVVSPRSVAMAAEAGVPMHVWTVNDPADMHRLLDWGVAGLVTDRADLGLEVLASRA